MTGRMAILGSVVGALAAPPGGAQEIVFEGNASEALFLDGGTIAIASEDRVFLVPSAQPGIPTRLGGSFAAVERIGRAPDGDLVVWDDSLWAAFVFDQDVERRVIPFPRPGMLSGEINFVALFTGDTGLFEEADIGNPFAPSPGRQRRPVRYVAITTDGARDVVWEALGREMAIHATDRGMASAPIVFGYGVLARRVDGHRFIVAQTELDEAFVVDREGRRLTALGLPALGQPVTEHDIEQERARLIAMRRQGHPLDAVLGTMLSEDQVRDAVEMFNAVSMQAHRAAPANSIPPRISDLRVDGEGRVWMRRFIPPGHTLAVWEARSLQGGRSHMIELPAEWILFDLRDGLGLVGVRDQCGAVTGVGLTEIPPR